MRKKFLVFIAFMMLSGCSTTSSLSKDKSNLIEKASKNSNINTLSFEADLNHCLYKEKDTPSEVSIFNEEKVAIIVAAGLAGYFVTDSLFGFGAGSMIGYAALAEQNRKAIDLSRCMIEKGYTIAK